MAGFADNVPCDDRCAPEPAAPRCVVEFPQARGAPVSMTFLGCALEVLLVEKTMVPREANAIP